MGKIKKKYRGERQQNKQGPGPKPRPNSNTEQGARFKSDVKSRDSSNTRTDTKKGQYKKGSSRKHNKERNKEENESLSEFEEVPCAFQIRKNEMEFEKAAGEESDGFEEEQKNTRELVQKQNRKNKKSGGFQSMGLSYPVYKGIVKRGYKVPTPIQRKTVPLIMDNKDVVAMARTGSGKTAAFLIPMFEKLKTHSAKSGARALILSPTRELALQTLKFSKELGKYTGLRAAVILGGDRMEDQFAAIHQNPDIIIATPGRFMHVLVEMELKLSAVEYIVFDEADRLFEMGFREQLVEILQRLPESKQTVLFSATLPKLLVDFAKAGLHDPTLIRLDVDTKLSENLKLAFLQCRTDEKLATLLYLLRNVVQPSQQTVIFVATKHHVEYLHMLLQDAGISCSYSYSSLDHTARKINVAKFQNKKTMVLIVTDLAARGIDIPMLDFVINYNFPAKPKLFVHRVGRVARAGRTGTAYSIIAPDEIAFVMDLHLFLGRAMKLVTSGKHQADESGLCGSVPQSIIDEEEDMIRRLHQKSELVSMKKVINNAYKQYVRTRPSPSAESFKRVKSILQNPLSVHPLFGQCDDNVEQERTKMLDSMKNYRPNSTIFEVNSSKKAHAYDMMKAKRDKHGKVIEVQKRSKIQMEEDNATDTKEDSLDYPEGVNIQSDDLDLKEIFSKVIVPKPHTDEQMYQPKKKKRRLQVKDEENYLSYRPKDFHAEKGLNLGTSFDNAAAGASFDLTGDEEQKRRKIENQMKWDRKKKKFVRETSSNPSKKKIKTESGNWISASYKSNLYKEWLDKNKAEDKDSDNEAESKSNFRDKGRLKVLGHDPKLRKGGMEAKTKSRKRSRPELKHKDQILKKRHKDAQKRNFQKYRERKNTKRKPGHGQKKRPK